MNPRNLPVAALALLILSAAPASADCPEQAGTEQAARTARKHLGPSANHRRGAQTRLSQEQGPGLGQDEQGGRKKKKKAKRRGKKKKKVGRRHRRGHGTKKKTGNPRDNA